MICTTCQAENPSTNRFCGECGTALAILCANCGASNEPGKKFCGQCGSTLTAQEQGSSTATSERRLVTVLFADLTGFTTFSEQRDPEEVRDLQSKYYERSRRVIHNFGGIIEKFVGDAVMAVWGAEISHEDDAERAVRAGFELIDVVAKLSADLGSQELSLRVGIHTGEAAVGPTDDHMGFVTGDLVNTASRLESAAEPGTILVGEATHNSASRSIAFESVGPQTLKGKTLPVAAWRATRVLSERGGRGRAEALEPPFVGRSDELRLLKDLLHTVGSESRARLVSLVGEAGIGKSRLVWEFLKYIDGLVEDIFWHEGRSPAYGDGVTLWALSEMIKARAGIAEGDGSEVIAERLDTALATYVPDESDRNWIRPHLGAVVGGGKAPGDRAELDAAVRLFFEGISRQGTTVLVFEDLHWADSELIDFVEDLTDWWRGRPILVITMARPDLLDRRPNWGTGRQGVISISLGPMSETDMARLVAGAVPGLPEHITQAIVEKAAGIPLYAVELLRGLLAQGELAGEGGDYRVVGSLSQLVVPESLQAVIGARLDRLDPDDRTLVQEAAVLGQSFSLTALAAITGQDPLAIEPRLVALSRRELLEPVRDPRSPERGQYRFIQGLIRDVALGRLSRESRRNLHLAAAEHLEAEDEPETAAIVASHYLQALDASPAGEQRDEIRSRALTSMVSAASRASDLRSHQQVISISESALDLADTDDERVRFWEMLTQAAGSVADAAMADRYAALAMDHHLAAGDQAAHDRVARSLAYVHLQTQDPERAAQLLRPIVEGREDLDSDPDLARAAGTYARALMLIRRQGAHDAVELALAALEKLELIPETVDALITKGTSLGFEGRVTEGRIVLEGAIQLAEQNELGESLARGLNNLAYILIGIDDEAANQRVASAYRVAQRLGDRASFLFASGQMVFSLLATGETDKAEALLADPALVGSVVSARIYFAAAELAIATLRGDTETVDQRSAEILELAVGVDDPQTMASVTDIEIVKALARRDMRAALDKGLVMLEKESWADATETISYVLLAAGILGDRGGFGEIAERMRRFHPRFQDHLHMARLLAGASPDSPFDPRAADSLIAHRLQQVMPLEAFSFVAAAAGMSDGETRSGYLAQARELASARGWAGLVHLLDENFD